MLKVLFALSLILYQDALPVIVSPQVGETLRGQVAISGNINLMNFSSAELSFGYASDPTSTWFPIQSFSAPTLDSALAMWDTTALTDGDYTLRLRVFLVDGAVQEVLVTDLHIRNDVPTPTTTPVATPSATSVPGFPTSTSLPSLSAAPVPVTVLPIYTTPTLLPANPVTLTAPSISSSFARGAAVTLLLFFLVTIFLRLRRF